MYFSYTVFSFRFFQIPSVIGSFQYFGKGFFRYGRKLPLHIVSHFFRRLFVPAFLCGGKYRGWMVLQKIRVRLQGFKVFFGCDRYFFTSFLCVFFFQKPRKKMKLGGMFCIVHMSHAKFVKCSKRSFGGAFYN